MTAKRSEQIALVLSRVFDPLVSLAGISLLLVFYTGLDFQQKIITAIVLFIFSILLPAGLLLEGVIKKNISGWDLSLKSERRTFLKKVVILQLMAGLFTFVLNPEPFQKIIIFLILLCLSAFFVSLFYKISLHLLLLTTLVLFFIDLLEISNYFILITIPSLMWARVQLKCHTFSQTIAGVVMPVLGFAFFSYFY